MFFCHLLLQFGTWQFVLIMCCLSFSSSAASSSIELFPHMQHANTKTSSMTAVIINAIPFVVLLIYSGAAPLQELEISSQSSHGTYCKTLVKYVFPLNSIIPRMKKKYTPTAAVIAQQNPQQVFAKDILIIFNLIIFYLILPNFFIIMLIYHF